MSATYWGFEVAEDFVNLGTLGTCDNDVSRVMLLWLIIQNTLILTLITEDNTQRNTKRIHRE